jgi:hypothetical protein
MTTYGKRSTKFPLLGSSPKKIQSAMHMSDRRKGVYLNQAATSNSSPRPVLSINPPNLFAPFGVNVATAAAPTLPISQTNPNEHYTCILQHSHVYQHIDTFQIVRIKTHEPSSGRHVDELMRWKSHSNILEILEVFKHAELISIVYEDMELTLNDIIHGPSGRLSDSELSTVFKEVRVLGPLQM